jgi:hypothetical protein
MRRLRARTVVVAAVGIAWTLAAGCKKGEGSSCKGDESTCLDKTTALACRDGKFVKVACRGPLACAKFRDRANCDDSVANDGDSCMGDGDEEYACTPDKKRALLCNRGRFERHLECRGKNGCGLLGRTVSCDTSVAVAGDPCKAPGAVACAEDEKHMLVCRDGKFALHRFCRGQFGCQLKADTPTCDETLSVEGDPCGLAGYVVCSVDGQSELVCQGGRFQKSRSCKKSGCVVTNRAGRAIDCD